MAIFAYYQLWQYRLWSFQTGGTRLERFLPKNQHTQGNYRILRIGLGGVHKLRLQDKVGRWSKNVHFLSTFAP